MMDMELVNSIEMRDNAMDMRKRENQKDGLRNR